MVAKRCWDRVRRAIEEYTSRFDDSRRRRSAGDDAAHARRGTAAPDAHPADPDHLPAILRYRTGDRFKSPSRGMTAMEKAISSAK
ncbi:hypothetical protein DK389_28990 [Methylobacterium durans]|uniref:Uncharacterized protein n=1 Tax=Methylobacterium durans TaxID=2202825 RepID=A0A2U8WEB4_9HYPH|nr:hypothetical protein DK389_28990 [Methylobacterium durans]